VGLIWLQDFFITQVAALYTLPGAYATQLLWIMFVASGIGALSNRLLRGFEEWKTLIGSSTVPRSARYRAYGTYYVSHVFRGLSLVVVWTTMILQMWT
jgi:hypothetical protein